jgi:rhodanese-related sulfurtransferase
MPSTSSISTLQRDPAKAKAYFEQEMAFTTGPVETERELKNNTYNIVDVRAAEDFIQGHVPGAINLPQSNWESLGGLSKDRVNLLYCYSTVCHLAKKAAVEFTSKGYPVIEMDGGFAAWKEYELPIEK